MAPPQDTTSRFDPNFTQNVIDNIGPKTPERERFVMASLIKHLHDFAREVELTTDEWMAGVHFVNSIGQISTNIRNEGQRVSDVLGLESLVDEIAHKASEETDEIPTSSTILGPFWSPNAPFRALGDSIIQDMTPHGQVTLMHGTVTDVITKQPIPNAIVDIWMASANGKYDFQDPDNQTPNNLRGKFRTNQKGEYYYYCLHPTAYSLPTDGPAGVLFELMDRHPMRPAHIHLMVSAGDRYKPVTTQLFPRDDQYVQSDTVFAVKDDLLIDFTPRKDDPKATLDLHYNITLMPSAKQAKETQAHL